MKTRILFIVCLIFSGASASQAQDDRVRIRIQEFTAHGHEFNRVILDLNPQRLTLKPNAGLPEEFQNGFAKHFTARSMIDHVQAQVIRNYRERNELNPDTQSGRELLDLLTYWDPHPHLPKSLLEFPAQDAEMAWLQRSLATRPRTDEYFNRPSWIIFICDRNDLSRIWASVKVVQVDEGRLLYEAVKGDPVIFNEAVIRELNGVFKDSVQFMIENLSINRGPYDFLQLLLKDTMEELKVFEDPNYERRVHIKAFPTMQPVYMSMGYRPEANYLWPKVPDGEDSFMGMAAGAYSRNMDGFFAEKYAHQSFLTPQQIKMVKVFEAARRKKLEVRMDPNTIKEIDISNRLMSLDSIPPSPAKACEQALGVIPFY